MALSRSYLVTLLLYISAVNELRLPQVTCQDEEGSQCIPRPVFLALTRLPDVSSNLAAYSRTTRTVQDPKNPNLMDDGEETEVCIPNSVYLSLLNDRAIRRYLTVFGRMQRMPYFDGRILNDSEDIEGDLYPVSEKRSIATLAKNDDLPITLQDREEEEEDEEKRSAASSEHIGTMIRRFLNEEARKNAQEILQEYVLPNGEFDMEALDRDYPVSKRNVGSLARDFALPNGRRNVASLARDYGLPSGKRNIGSLARDRMLPYSGKRNVASLARDYALPYGKRYLASLARTGELPYTSNKRGVASLARNSDFPTVTKRGISAPAGMIYRTLSRQGTPRNQMNFGENKATWQAGNRSTGKDDSSGKRSRRQVDFSDEYPLPVMQNANLLDYEDMIEALAEGYPNAEKRFMGLDSTPEKQADVEQLGYPEIFQESKRHIGSLARLGWLPTFRAVRVSRSPRCIIARENPPNGSAANNTPITTPWPLKRNLQPSARHFQALHQYCQHSFPPKPKFSSYHRQMLLNAPRRT